MAPSNEVLVTIDNPDTPIPGQDITATATLTLTKPLSVSEFTVSIYGRTFSRIYRQYVFSNFRYDWRGQGFFFKRFVVLIQTPTTLPPGTHTFPFRLQLPATTEQVRGNWHMFNKWKPRDPFPGKDNTHPLPGTLADMAASETWGSTEGKVEYIIEANIQKGPEAGFLDSMPKDTRTFTVASLPRPDLPQSLNSAQIPWQQVVRTIQTPDGPANITCRLPQVLIQGAKAPIYLKSDRSLVLTGLKIKLSLEYLVRGRNLIWPEKRTSVTPGAQLVKAETGSLPLSAEYVPVRVLEISRGVPLAFVTFNLACLAHWLEIKFRVTEPGGNQETKAVMKDISVQVQSWVGGWAGENGQGQGKQVGGSFARQVFNEEEYRKWQAEKK